MSDRDVLFGVKNNFYIGAYNNAINEASDLQGLTEAEQTEKDVFVYRSYIAIGSHDVSARSSRSAAASRAQQQPVVLLLLLLVGCPPVCRPTAAPSCTTPPLNQSRTIFTSRTKSELLYQEGSSDSRRTYLSTLAYHSTYAAALCSVALLQTLCQAPVSGYVLVVFLCNPVLAAGHQ
jgi:hypothetical protein